MSEYGPGSSHFPEGATCTYVSVCTGASLALDPASFVGLRQAELKSNMSILLKNWVLAKAFYRRRVVWIVTLVSGDGPAAQTKQSSRTCDFHKPPLATMQPFSASTPNLAGGGETQRKAIQARFFN